MPVCLSLSSQLFMRRRLKTGNEVSRSDRNGEEVSKTLPGGASTGPDRIPCRGPCPPHRNPTLFLRVLQPTRVLSWTLLFYIISLRHHFHSSAERHSIYFYQITWREINVQTLIYGHLNIATLLLQGSGLIPRWISYKATVGLHPGCTATETWSWFCS